MSSVPNSQGSVSGDTNHEEINDRIRRLKALGFPIEPRPRIFTPVKSLTSSKRDQCINFIQFGVWKQKEHKELDRLIDSLEKTPGETSEDALYQHLRACKEEILKRSAG
jgi:hypothetical protein